MKSYTGLEQSRKLAEILPLESADMYYEPADGFCTEPSEPMIGDIKYAHPRSIPCWSLSALLDIIPSGKALIQDKWDLTYKCICNNVDTSYFNNPVDACYEMIVKLYDEETLH